MKRGSGGMIFGIEEKRRRVGGRGDEMHLERGPKLPPWLLRWSSILRAWKVGLSELMKVYGKLMKLKMSAQR
jgi:hypothetical protein